MAIIYNLIFIVFALFYGPVFLFTGKKRQGLRQRLGIYPRELVERLNRRKNIWIHAVSVGETMAISCLVYKLRDRYPGHRLVITTVTETGNSVARKLAKEDDIVLFLPFDISFIVRKVMTYISPSVLIITETELWPNLIREAHKMGVAVILINGRISDRSFAGYSSIKFMLASMLEKVTLFLMQTEADKDRIVSLGAEGNKVEISGNVKFDGTLSVDISEDEKERLRLRLDIKEQEKLFVAGSTHPGEEDTVISAFKNLKVEFKNLRLLIAPRHIERAGEVEKIIEKYGFIPVRISQLTVDSRQSTVDNVFILDTIGQLKNFYSIADVVFVGGSLVRKGGQNMIEPAVFKKPIIFGPYTFNFKDIAELFLEKKAAIMVKDAASLQDAVTRILRDADFANNLGIRAKGIVEGGKGATDFTMREIGKVLK